MIRDTTLEAWEQIIPHLPDIERTVMNLLRESPRTCEEIEHIAGMKHQTASSCLTRLSEKQWIYDTGNRGENDTGRGAIIWACPDVPPPKVTPKRKRVFWGVVAENNLFPDHRMFDALHYATQYAVKHGGRIVKVREI